MHVDFQSPGPFGQTERFSAESDVVVLSGVAVLLGTGSPTTIPRLVIAVVVREAVQAVFRRRARPQVGQEGSKVVPPSVAKLDPPPAVSTVSPVPGIATPPYRVGPRVVFRGATVAVSLIFSPCRVAAETPATFDMIVAKAAAGYTALVATIATAVPIMAGA